MRIALVTDELPGLTPSGGIGSAFAELARLLARSGHRVTVLVVLSGGENPESWDLARRDYARAGISLQPVRVSDHAHEHDPSSRSYAVLRGLEALGPDLDVVHVAEFKGLGFHAMAAKRQGVALTRATFVVQLHGPVRWTLESNGLPFTVTDQLKYDFMERKCIQWADELISPSAFLRDWFVARGWVDDPSLIHVIKNVCSQMHGEAALLRPSRPAAGEQAKEIIFFGRHEERKGIAVFCDALDKLNDELTESGVTVTFLGGFGRVRDGHSGLHILDKAKRWTFPWTLLPGLDREGAMDYLAQAQGALVLVASRSENSPYAVLEALALDLPVLTSREGGAHELIHPDDRAWSCVDIATPRALASALSKTLVAPLATPRLAEGLGDIEQQWLAKHAELADSRDRASGGQPSDTPLPSNVAVEHRRITVGITHFERPEKLLHAVTSVLRQDYPEVEVIVVDDGTESARGTAGLATLEPLLERAGVKLVRRENGYLGAARNTVIEHATGELVLFLDDDDLAMPHLLSTLEKAQRSTGAPVVVALNLYLHEDRRAEFAAQPETFQALVNYVPLGGPLSLAPMENVMGAATALMSLEVLRSVGGYSELYGVGHEDYETYLKLLQAGHEIVVCPTPLYLYEVGKPSMISGTSVLQNYRRVASAVDPSLASVELSDLAELSAGRSATEVANGRKDWIYSQATQPEVRLMLWRDWPSAAETLSALKTIAEADGDTFSAACLSHSAAAVSRLTLGSLSGDSDVRPSFARAIRKPVDTQPDLDPDLAEAYLMWTAGLAYDDALLRFARSTRILTPADLATLRGFPWGEIGERNRAAVNAVVDRIETAPLSPSTEAGARMVLAAIAWQQGKHSRFVSLLEEVLVAEEHAYLTENPDIAEAIRRNTVPSGVFHYLAYGSHEGRTGFAALQQAAEALGDLDGAPDSLEALVAVLRPDAGPRSGRARLTFGTRSQTVSR